MEQMLWDGACSIRGEKDAPKFKDYIHSLIFIKRLSDVFDDEVKRLIETYGDRETATAVLEADHSLVRFYLSPECRWPVVSRRESFPWPKDKTPKTLGEREISDQALSGVIETLSDPRYRLGLCDVEPDFLGRAYEYLLRKFAESRGQSAGEFFTPQEVGWIIAYVLRPRQGDEVYDYACGSAGLLIKCELALMQRERKVSRPLRLYGQELTGSSYTIARMNMVIHDMEGFVKVIATAEAATNDFNLSPSRYVVTTESGACRALPEIVREVRQLTKEGASVSAEVEELLKKMGF